MTTADAFKASRFVFYKQEHKYMLDDKELPSVTTVLAEAGMYGNNFYTRDAALRGTAVHTACELYLHGRLDDKTMDEELVPYVEAFKKFLSMSGFTLMFSEMPLYHSVLRYAGTVDMYGEYRGKFVIVDIKSGNPHPTHDVQIGGGYKPLLVNNKYQVDDAYKLYLRAGDYKFEVVKDCWKAEWLFISALNLKRWKETNL